MKLGGFKLRAGHTHAVSTNDTAPECQAEAAGRRIRVSRLLCHLARHEKRRKVATKSASENQSDKKTNDYLKAKPETPNQPDTSIESPKPGKMLPPM